MTLEVNAPAAGTLGDISAKDGEIVTPGALLGSIVQGAGGVPPRLPAGQSHTPRPRKPESGGATPQALRGQGGKKTDGSRKGDMLDRHRARTPTRLRHGSVSAPAQARAPSAPDDASREERERITKPRQKIAQRLVEAQHTAAILTTFNEVDMAR